MIAAAIRPVVREALIAHYRWALRDLQHKDPHHKDIPFIVTRLRDLRAERYDRSCYLRRVWGWL